jgi:hypothetical protein
MSPALPYPGRAANHHSRLPFSRARPNSRRKVRCSPASAVRSVHCLASAPRSVGRHWPAFHAVNCSAKLLRFTTTEWRIRTSASSIWCFWSSRSPRVRNSHWLTVRTAAASPLAIALGSSQTAACTAGTESDAAESRCEDSDGAFRRPASGRGRRRELTRRARHRRASRASRGLPRPGPRLPDLSKCHDRCATRYPCWGPRH